MCSARYATTAFILAGLSGGCATRAATTRGSNEAGIGAPASSVVTAQELARIVRQGSLMEALQQLRPAMLLSRGTPPVVSVDGAPPAELSILRMIPVNTVREVRLERASSGPGHSIVLPNGDVKVGDLVRVTTWQGGPRPDATGQVEPR